MTAAQYPVLDIRGLTKHYAIRSSRAPLVALDGVDLTVEQGMTTALVGESGSGKSTLARCLVGLVRATSGAVLLDGVDIAGLNSVQLSRVYRDIQMVFQDPSSSLNPRMSVLETIREPLRLHLQMGRREQEDRVRELIDLVGMEPAHLDRLPHELSGGQRQRVGIARAVAVEPKVVILDEPTSSLDVSVRGQILDLLHDLQSRLGMTYLFISHDLQAVRRVADRVAVMYLGSIVEEGTADDVLDRPRHPYTQALMSAAPVPEYGVHRDRLRLHGEIPSPIGLGDECRLVGRCPFAQDACRAQVPPLIDLGDGHRTACPVRAAA